MTRILIIEDNQTLNQAYKLILQKEGYAVRTAHNGNEALKVLRFFRPRVILLDMLMPVMSGLEFLQKFQPTQHPKTTILILSNLNEDGEVQQALDLGAHTYILKASTSPAQLLEHIRGSIH